MSLSRAWKRLNTSTATFTPFAIRYPPSRLTSAVAFERDRVVFDKRPRAEVAEAHTGENVVYRVDGDTAAAVLERAGNAIAGDIEIVNRRVRERQIAIERQPAQRAVVVREWTAAAMARPSGFGRPRIAGEHELRGEVERPDGGSSTADAGSAAVRTPACSACRAHQRASRDRRVRPATGSTAIVVPRPSLLWKP